MSAVHPSNYYLLKLFTLKTAYCFLLFLLFLSQVYRIVGALARGEYTAEEQHLVR